MPYPTIIKPDGVFVPLSTLSADNLYARKPNHKQGGVKGNTSYVNEMSLKARMHLYKKSGCSFSLLFPL